MRKQNYLALTVSWIITNIQSLRGLLRISISAFVMGEDVEVVDRFTYLCSVILSSISCESEVLERLGCALQFWSFQIKVV